MKSFSASLVSAVLLAAAVSAQDSSFQILTPNPPTQCVPVQIKWNGGTPPFFLSIFPGDQPQAPSLEQFPNLQSSPFTWNTNIAAGQSVGFQVTDNTGAVAQSGSVIIQPGPDTCLNGTASSGSGSATGSATAPGNTATSGATGATTAATGATTGTGSATTGGSHSSSSGASGTGTSSSAGSTATGGSGTNAGFVNGASMGVVGVLSAVAAALLA
ncbi:hypothetical protein GY45DRAFT_1340053 [Cubamyces sp. BRFM 1775]|nr:hypothetical protein GY45DRAFT_1340053 [Cubamyces sp. BRFM 1775]